MFQIDRSILTAVLFKVDIITKTLEQDRMLRYCAPTWYRARPDCTEEVDCRQKTWFVLVVVSLQPPEGDFLTYILRVVVFCYKRTKVSS